MGLAPGDRKNRQHAAGTANKTNRSRDAESAPADSEAGGAEVGDAERPSAAGLIADIGLEFDLWHDPTQSAFATVGPLSYAVRAKAFRSLLINEFRKRYGGKVPGSESVSAALNAIEGAAVHDNPERQVFVRIAA